MSIERELLNQCLYALGESMVNTSILITKDTEFKESYKEDLNYFEWLKETIQSHLDEVTNAHT